MLTHLTFLWSILLMCGPIILLLWHKEKRLLKRYELVLLSMIILSVVFVGPADYVALHWGAWKYGAAVTTGVYILTLPETYLFGIAVTVIVASVTLVQAEQIDNRRSTKTLSRVLAKKNRRH